MSRSARDKASGQVPRSLLETTSREQEELRRAQEFERFAVDLARELSGAKPDELEAAIVEGLRALAYHLGLERVLLNRLHEGRLHVRYHWLDPDLPPERASFIQEVDPSDFYVAKTSVAGETVAVCSPDDLPASAESDRRLMKRQQVQSVLVIPGTIAKEVVGVVLMDSYAKSQRWPDPLVQRLTLPVDLLFGAVLRLESTAQIEDLRRFERTVAELCASLVALKADELDQGIERCLESLGKVLGAERTFFGRVSEDQSILNLQAHWQAAETEPPRPEILNAYLVEASWAAREIVAGRVINTGRGLRDLPEDATELREQLERNAIRSFLLVPIRVDGRALGFIGLDSVSAERDYPGPIVERLQMVADVLGDAMARVAAEAALRESLAEVAQLKERLERENVYLRREILADSGDHRIVGESPALLRVLSEARQVATTASTVLVTGETGTGKELLARLIHETSDRRDRPLVKVNCATLPSTLVESELFGRERGAYTGAMTRLTGRFEVADTSTIFLDEIGDLPIETQVKLLRVLEEGEFERLGSSKTIRVDVRMIAATNHDLEAEIEAGRFRRDLFYRLNVFPLTMPPLRERPGDIRLLTWAFVEDFAASLGKPIESIAQATLQALESYPWPGNVRELRNVIERAVILCQGPKLEIELPTISIASREASGDTSLDGAQRRHILSVLETTGWRVRGKGGAAELLRMKPSTLEDRMKKLGIRRPI